MKNLVAGVVAALLMLAGTAALAEEAQQPQGAKEAQDVNKDKAAKKDKEAKKDKDAKEAKEAQDVNTDKEARTFFVAQDASTKKCKIIRTEPDGADLIMVGTVSYPTRGEAQAAEKDAAECKQAKEAEATNGS